MDLNRPVPQHLPHNMIDSEWRQHWPVVLASTIGLSLTTLYVYSTGAFIGPIQAQFGWSRAFITSGLTIATTCAAVVGPVVGAAVDKIGPRRIALPGIVFYCAALACLSQVSSQASWIVLWIAIGLTSAGVKPTLWATAVSRLFLKNRGLALAITLCGAGIGASLVPMASNALITAFGWRGSYLALALGWGLVTFLLVFFGMRGTALGDKSASGAAPAIIHQGASIRQGLTSWRYQALVLAVIICGMVTMAMVVSLIPLLGSFGASRAVAARIAATVGLSTVVGRLASGRMIDRIDPRYISALSMAVPGAAAALMLAASHNMAALTAAVSLLGLAVGAELEAAAYLTARYFGLRHFGFLFSIITSGLTIGTGVGPLIASLLFDRTGSYVLLLAGTVPLSAVSALLIGWMGPPPAKSVVVGLPDPLAH